MPSLEGMNTQAKAIEVPPDDELLQELKSRHEQASEARAYHETQERDHQRQAHEWANVMGACNAAISTLEPAQPINPINIGGTRG